MMTTGAGYVDIPSAWRWTRDHGLRDAAVRCLAAAVAAVEPGRLVTSALADVDPGRYRASLAIGKAARAMADAGRAWREAAGATWLAELVVVPENHASVASGMIAHGDHPVPGTLSWHAADAVASWTRASDAAAPVLLLLSGGTSSLIGAPISGLTQDSLADVFRAVMASGLDIAQANAVRKRFLRWGAGRLARALAPREVQALALSDVPGDDPGTIGSGPVSPDPLHAAEIARIIATAGLALPDDVHAALHAQRDDPRLETPKPGEACFERVSYRVIGNNRMACDAAASAAERTGWAPLRWEQRLGGEAAVAGARFARSLLARRRAADVALVAGGETTVTLSSAPGIGGRAHEFALAAARELAGHPEVVILAAGTDGKDGATDAAGALVDGTTWQRVTEGETALARHDSGRVLSAIGASLVTGPTGTNVMDLAIGLARRRITDAEASPR